MKKKSAKSERKALMAGLMKERFCNLRHREGVLTLWDCEKGSPMNSGPEGERWAVQWRPPGRGKTRHVHARTQRLALSIFRGLGRGDPDQWGMFDDPKKPELPETEKQDGAQTAAEVAGGAEGVNSIALLRSMPLTVALKTAFTVDEIVTVLKDMLGATRPIYGSADGAQQVVGYEPDWQTRREGAKLLLSYREGLPLKRTEEVRKNVVSSEDVERRIATSPAYRDALRQYLEHAESQDRRRLKTVMENRAIQDDPHK